MLGCGQLGVVQLLEKKKKKKRVHKLDMPLDQGLCYSQWPHADVITVFNCGSLILLILPLPCLPMYLSPPALA